MFSQVLLATRFYYLFSHYSQNKDPYLKTEPWNDPLADLSQGMANSQMEPWNNLWADLSQGMANSQMEPWNNLWADLSQGMANSQMEPWNNLWADLSQGMANSQMEPWNNLWADLSQGMANSQLNRTLKKRLHQNFTDWIGGGKYIRKLGEKLLGSK